MLASFGLDPNLMQHGRYTVIRKLAEGGMAEIFLAKQHGSQGFEKPVVLKRIHAALYADEQFRNMLIDEAHISMGLSHNNIVQVLDLGQAGGRYFLVLELIDGWDLGKVIRRADTANVRLPPDLALYLVAQVCRALGYAHAKTNAEGKPLGIVHRDVSPQNVLISEQGEVKLADFGIAKARRKRENTETGVVKGKIAFMSPEQALGQELDPRSDLYSLGTLLYLLAIGRRPFEGATDLETLLRVQEGNFTPPTEAQPDAHPAIVALIDRAMQFDREQRYHSADEMLADVESVLRGAFGSPGQTELKQWLHELAHLDGELPIGRSAPGMIPQALAAEPDEFASGGALVLGDDGIEDTALPTPPKGERLTSRVANRMTGAEPTVADLRISAQWLEQETPRAIRSTQPSRWTGMAVMLGVFLVLGGAAVAVLRYTGQTQSNAVSQEKAALEPQQPSAEAEPPPSAPPTSPEPATEVAKARPATPPPPDPVVEKPDSPAENSAELAAELNREVLRKRGIRPNVAVKELPPPANEPPPVAPAPAAPSTFEPAAPSVPAAPAHEPEAPIENEPLAPPPPQNLEPPAVPSPPPVPTPEPTPESVTPPAPPSVGAQPVPQP